GKSARAFGCRLGLCRTTGVMRERMPAGSALLLSTARATRGDTRLALVDVCLSAALFAAAVPFAQVALVPSPALIAAYQSALVINDALTAVLLFAQFGLLHARSLLVLASGYLFASLVAILHALTFPGMFTETDLLGAGMQTTSWLYIAW